MASSIVCGGRRRRWEAWLAAALLAVAPAAHSAETLHVILDRAQVIRLPDHVATIVVGNPTIADVSVQPGGMLVVTGRGYGTTNLMALDRAGRTILEKVVQVASPNDNIVVVYRGVERETFSCTPHCDMRLTLGDSFKVYDMMSSEIGIRNALGQTGAPPPKN